MTPDEALQLLEDTGDIKPEIIDALKGSKLRADLNAEQERRKQAETGAAKFRDAALKGQFAKHDLRLNPQALKLPEDLDVLDDQAVTDWLVEAGAVEAKPAVPNEEFEAAERVAGAGSGAGDTRTGVITPDTASTWPPDKWIAFEKAHPAEAEALCRGEEVTGIAG